MSDQAKPPEAQQVELPLRNFTPPSPGEVIISEGTGTPYTIGNYIGEGSFGMVYACSDSWGNDLAAKVLKPNNLPYERIRGDAIAELMKLQALRHPNITYIYEAFEFRDTFYLITERCHQSIGGLMQNAWFQGPLWVRAIARNMLQALHFLHCNQMVHQDVHLGNVLTAYVRSEMNPNDLSLIIKVGDLGLAKLVTEVNAINTLLAHWMLPPEVLEPAEFGKLDNRIDIYHAGLLLLSVYAGRQLQFTKQQILAGEPRRYAESLPPPFNLALSKALRRHAHLRTQTALEFWRDLCANV